MSTVAESGDISGVLIVELCAHGDERGLFVETYRRSWFPQGREMVQSNRSEKQCGALVGIHYHLEQSDYWYVMNGTARIVLVDLRSGSPTNGAVASLDFAGTDHRGVYIPPGVGHGFSALTDLTLTYQVDGYYDPADELGVAWDDPALAIDWGVADPVVSERDTKNPTVEGIDAALRPAYRAGGGSARP